MRVLAESGGTVAPKPDTGPSLPPRRPEPVTRRYRPESAALDDLVEVLYRLLVEVPAGDSGMASAPAESTCFPVAHK
jgi:hypothetical protein